MLGTGDGAQSRVEIRADGYNPVDRIYSFHFEIPNLTGLCAASFFVRSAQAPTPAFFTYEHVGGGVADEERCHHVQDCWLNATIKGRIGSQRAGFVTPMFRSAGSASPRDEDTLECIFRNVTHVPSGIGWLASEVPLQHKDRVSRPSQCLYPLGEVLQLDALGLRYATQKTGAANAAPTANTCRHAAYCTPEHVERERERDF